MLINHQDEKLVTQNRNTKNLVITNKIISFLYCLGFLSLIFISGFISDRVLLRILSSQENDYINKLRIFLIIIFIIGLLFSCLLCVSLWIGKFQEYHDYFLQYLFLSFFSLNILIFISFIIFKFQAKSENSLTWKQSLKTKIGIKKWKTKDYTLIALFIALTVVLTYIESNLIPNLPYGGTVALKYIPIIIIAFLHSMLAGLITGGISALLSLIFISSGFIISPWSYLLDYFLPMITPCLAGIMRFNINKKHNNYIMYVNYVVMCFAIYFIIWFWQVIVGYFVWDALFPGNIWHGFSGWLYAIVYNFISVFVLTYPISQIVIPIILRGTAPYFWSRW